MNGKKKEKNILYIVYEIYEINEWLYLNGAKIFYECMYM